MKESFKQKLIWAGVGALLIVFGYVMGFAAGNADRIHESSFSQVFQSQFINSELGDTDFNIFWSVLDVIREKFPGEVDYRDLVYSSTEGLVEGLNDPYSTFITPDENESFQNQLEGRYEGIGIRVEFIEGRPVIVSPVSGSPAEEAGLQPKDVILAVDDQPVEEMTESEVIRAMRGRPGTQVTLTINRNGEVIEVPVNRREIEVPSVTVSFEDDIAIVRINRFAPDTGDLFSQEITDILTRDPQGMVLDLRSNPGGLFDQAISVANEFLEGGVIVEEQKSDGEVISHSADGTGALTDIDLVGVINGGTASGAEIVAGALRDHGRAELVGQQTFGKGSVQSVERFADGSSLKITIGEWHTPDGQSISPDGISPTHIVEPESDGDVTTDAQLDFAVELLNNE